MTAAVALLLHGALMLAAAPVLVGLLRRRAGADQAWRDLRRLLRKQSLRPEGTTWLFAAAPGTALACTALAALLVPSFTLGMATAPLGDLLVLAGLLALARAAVLLAGFDGGAAAGIAVQRVLLTRLAADPAVFVLILVVALLAGSTNLDAAAAALRESGGLRWSLALSVAAAAAALAAADEPTAPADYAGRDLALLHMAAHLRRLLILSLLATLVLPFGLAAAGSGPEAWVVGAACWAVKIGLLAAGAAGLGAMRARLRPLQAPELAGLGLVLALLAAAVLFASQGAA